MNGLEKILENILTAAKDAAASAVQRADEESAAIASECDAAIAALRQKAEKQSADECGAVISRAQSAAQMAARNSILEAKRAILDEVYAAALKEYLNMDGESYRTFLTEVAAAAVLERCESMKKRIALYGEEDEEMSCTYEILMNKADAEKYCGAIAAGAKSMLCGKVGDEVEILAAADRYADIDGGFILVNGDIEINYSFGMLIDGMRDELDPVLIKLLFD